VGACLAAIAVSVTSTSAAALSSCAIMGVTGMSFGAYDSQDGRPTDSTGAVSIRCTGVEAMDSVQIHLGRGGANSSIARSMRFQNDRLAYNLYVDAQRTLIWGDGTGGTAIYSRRPPDGAEVSVPVFGRIPPRQSVVPGPYTDLVVVTVLF
jgi:spore coat protein U-like protein